ncbi:MAG TPA: CHRD domain-containing protein [Nitrososphaeraceae archaeon]|nr:CHRD domain-containing protein [Nitrososphaeraceae archaeon]
MKDRNILSAAAILVIASVLVLISTIIMTNMPNVFATTDVFTATLSGDKEVPPLDTNAKGTAGFSQPHLNNMSFGIQVYGMEKVTGAHIHLGKEGTNGPVVVTLFKAQNETGTGPLNGQLVGGSITNDMLEGPLAGKAVETDLVKAIQSGEAYVNVHTTDNPNGAIRGQITVGNQ